MRPTMTTDQPNTRQSSVRSNLQAEPRGTTMKTLRTMNRPAKALVAAACAILLCLCALPFLTGADYSEESGEESTNGIATPSATESVQIGWYGTVSASGEVYDPESERTVSVEAGSFACKSSGGGWVNLSKYNITFEADGIHVATADLPALRNAIYIPQDPDASLSGIVWRPVFEEVTVPDITPDESKTTEDKKTEPSLPKTESKPDISDTDKPSVSPEPPQKLSEPTTEAPPTPAPVPAPVPTRPSDLIPQTPIVKGQESTEAESEILSLQCRKSELEEKTAELEAQGYEILHIAKLPSWLR